MRVLVITSLYPNACDPGRAPFNRQQIAGLAAQEHEVRVIAPVAWTDEVRAWRSGGAAIAAGRRVVCDGIAVDHPRYYFPPRVLRSWHGRFYARSIRRRFDHAARALVPDVVFGTWAYPDAWAAVRLARAAGLPAVVKVHGCDLLCGGRGLASDPVRHRRTIEALRAADGVVTVSQHLAERVASLGVDPGSIRTVYSGIDSTKFFPGSPSEARAKLGLPQDQRIVLFVGRLDPVKGLEVLLDACAALRAAGKRFKCLIVGDGALRGWLAARIRELQLQDVVQPLGGRPLHELGDWYRAPDLVVAPSHSEGMPNVLLEAMACGTPVVATAVGGIPEIAHLGACSLVRPRDPQSLAGAIAARLDATATNGRPAYRRSHGESAAELAAFFGEVIARVRRQSTDASPAGYVEPHAASLQTS